MEQFFAQLDQLFQSGDLSATEAFLAEALFNCRPQDRVTILNEQGAFYRGISRYERSEAAFSEALDILRAAGQEGTRPYATLLLNLAGTHRLAGRYDLAAELYLRSLDMLDPDRYEFASVLNNLALTRHAQGQLDEACALATQALDWIKAHGAPDHEVATSLNNLASICISKKDWDGAAALLDQALERYDAMPESNVHHAAALYSRGIVYLGQGMLDRAEADFQQALELTDHFFGHNAEYDTILNALDMVRRARGGQT